MTAALRLEAMCDLAPLQQLVAALLGVADECAVLQVNARSGVGCVFIDGGRVCWAAVPETRRYLSDRLIEAQVDRAVIDALILEARTTHRPLGELLTSRGHMTETAFSSILYEHSVESMLHMANSPITSISKLPRKAGAFSLATSFSPLSLIAEVAGRLLCMPAFTLPAQGQALPRDLLAVAVVVRNDIAMPVRVLGSVQPELSLATELAAVGHDLMRRIGHGSVSFRRGTRCWAVSGQRDRFVVSEGTSAHSFSWMVTQSDQPDE